MPSSLCLALSPATSLDHPAGENWVLQLMVLDRGAFQVSQDWLAPRPAEEPCPSPGHSKWMM